MRKNTILLLIILFYLNATHVSNSAEIQIIKNVNIIPMNNEDILRNKTVVIKNGIISQIKDYDIKEKFNRKLIIDGKNMYLIPGLIDMHAHIFDKDHLILFVVNGVTTIRDMGEFPDPNIEEKSIQKSFNFNTQLELRDKVNNGELLGPTIYLCGHLLDGDPPMLESYQTPIKDINDIEDIILKEKELGYDFIKTYANLRMDMFLEIIRVAKKHNMKVAAHLPKITTDFTIEDTLNSGVWTIEHMTAYYDYDIVGQFMRKYAKITAEKGIWNCPTISMLKNFYPPGEKRDNFMSRELAQKYVSPELKEFWKKEYEISWTELTESEKFQYSSEYMDYLIYVAKMLKRGKAKIVAGTDCGMPFHLAGFSMHEELDIYVNEVGFTPYEALKSATYDAALCLEKDNKIGSIEVGKIADMILVEKNPLNKIENTKTIKGVFLKGEYFSRKDIKKMLYLLEKSYKVKKRSKR